MRHAVSDEFDFWKVPMIDKLIIITVSCMFASFIVFSTSTYSTLSVLAAAAVLLFLYCVKTKGHIRRTFFSRYLMDVLLFGVFCVVSSLWAAASASDASKAGITVLEIGLCMSIVYLAFSEYATIQPLLKSIELGGYIIAVYSIVAYGGLREMMYYASNGIRLGVEFAHINAIGRILAIVVIVKLHSILHSRLKLTDVFILLPLAVIITCQSRTPILEIALGFFILLSQTFASMSKNWLNRILLFVLGASTAVIALYMLSTLPVFSGIATRMAGLTSIFTGTGKTDTSSIARMGMIELGLSLFARHPIFGIGMGNARHFNTFLDAYLHNNYVELLADGGIFGFILFYRIHAYVLIQLNKYKSSFNHENLLLMVVVIMLMISDIGGVSYYSKDFYFLIVACYLQIRIAKRRYFTASHQ